jgi:hypothetical protein
VKKVFYITKRRQLREEKDYRGKLFLHEMYKVRGTLTAPKPKKFVTRIFTKNKPIWIGK